MVDPDLLVGRFQMTMAIFISILGSQKFSINMAAKTMPCKLDIQSFQVLAPLSKVDPFGHEVSFLKGWGSGRCGRLLCPLSNATPWNCYKSKCW